MAKRSGERVPERRSDEAVRGQTRAAIAVVIAGHSASKTRVNALVTRQSILFAKNSYEEDGPPEIGSTRFRGALVRKSGKPDLRGQARG